MKAKHLLIDYRIGLIISLFLCIHAPLRAQTHAVDTIRTHDLPEVIISERYQTQEVRSMAPIQMLTQARLSSMNVLQVSDAVKHFAGVTVKDYGGIGGLKTVSLRSLGAEHTAVGYDGIALSDCQTGQIDIGRFSLDNVDRISLSNGQSDNIFQPARFFAAAGILNIQTLTPAFVEGKQTNIIANIKAGSFGFVNPALRLEQKLSSKWTLTANAEWMRADGQYPYTLHYGNANDSTSREKRKNSQVETLRAEAALFGNFNDREQLRTKIYYYQSSRGLPGATTLYYDYASQHLWDKNIFIQSQYKRELSRKWVFQLSAKWNWSYQRYLDPDYKGTEGKTDNSYYQQEYYLSAALLFRATQNLSFSMSTDGSVNTLNANTNNFADPTRYSGLAALAGKYVNDWITVSASVLATAVKEKTDFGAAAGNHHKLSPFVSASFKPFKHEDWRIRIFCKDIFRLPNFNDLYYYEVGNANLVPEKTRQYNIGMTYARPMKGFVDYFSATVDAYYNKVEDKIIAIPTKNIFVWSMTNLGEVEIKGIDATASLNFAINKDIDLELTGNYTYQRALDTTQPGGKTYKQQIAYTPRASGSGQALLKTPWVNLSYSMLHSGKRYALGQNTTDNRMEAYTDHSIAASKELRINRIRLFANVEVLNLMNKNYEVVRYFPMPGRSLRATLKLTY